MPRAMSHTGQYGPPMGAATVRAVPIENGCTPPSPSTSYPARPFGAIAIPRAMSQVGQYGAPMISPENALLPKPTPWRPPKPSST